MKMTNQDLRAASIEIKDYLAKYEKYLVVAERDTDPIEVEVVSLTQSLDDLFDAYTQETEGDE